MQAQKNQIPKQFNFSQLDNQYKINEILGQGAYGQVFKCQNKQTNQIVAIKKLLMDSIEVDEGIPPTTVREIAILKKVKHPNLVTLREVAYKIDDRQFYMVFDYVKQDLQKYIDRQKKSLPEQEIKSIMYQILQGVQCLHQRRILHRDIKPLNILISDEKKISICDFGLSRSFSLPQSQFTLEIATLYYRAPEIMMGDENYSTAVDIWAVGCVLGQLLTKNILIEGNSQIDMLFRIFQIFGTPNDNNYFGVSSLQEYKIKFPQFNAVGIKEHLHQLGYMGQDPQVIDLIQSLLCLDPNQRPSAKDALLHPYFDSIRKLNI